MVRLEPGTGTAEEQPHFGDPEIGPTLDPLGCLRHSMYVTVRMENYLTEPAIFPPSILRVWSRLNKLRGRQVVEQPEKILGAGLAIDIWILFEKPVQYLLD